MGRSKKKRFYRQLDSVRVFKPVNVPLAELEVIEIAADEFEALRLCDLEKKSQIEAGGIMQVSRATVQRLLLTGRAKVMRAFLQFKGIKINKGEAVEC